MLARLAMAALTLAASSAWAQTACGPGQVVVDDAGHCCSPGQSWDPSVLACSGTVERTCGPDQVPVDDERHCCSVGQTWNASTGSCAAPPKPPADLGEDIHEPPPLHDGRFMIGASVADALAPSTISPVGVGAIVNHYFRDWVGVAAEGHYFLGGTPPLPSVTRWPLQETGWDAQLELSFILFSVGANSGSVAFDAFAFLGPGVISTRPVAEIVPTRLYDYAAHVDVTAAVGVRLFLMRNVALALQIRDLAYVAANESVSATATPVDGQGPYASSSVVNQIELEGRVELWIP